MNEFWTVLGNYFLVIGVVVHLISAALFITLMLLSKEEE